MNRHRTKREHQSCCGITLVEMMITVVISTALGIGAILCLIAAQKSAATSFRFNQINQEARLVSDTLVHTIRSAVSIEPSYQSFTTSNDTLILKLPSINADEDAIDIENVFDYIIYHPDNINGTYVIVSEILPSASSIRTAEKKVIGAGISSSAYTGTFLAKPDALGAYVIHYQLMATRNLKNKTYNFPLSGSVRLRNKF